MDFLATARQIVCNIIAVALSMTAAAVESLLPRRPDWIERVEQLAIQLRSISEHSGAGPNAARDGTGPADFAESAEENLIDTDKLLLAYNQLWQFVHDLRSEGLSLDDNFCERIEREWSVTTLLTYIRNADRSMQEYAGKTLETASSCLARQS